MCILLEFIDFYVGVCLHEQFHLPLLEFIDFGFSISLLGFVFSLVAEKTSVTNFFL